ncbi:TIGR03084 family protein [Vineibacter terrae]|uniref:TIGR03084 family protein n=1 Tax=Vineibacter terrae TaxID=2586908 RepID=A0A5C8PU81_9HYPH|nr:TIGR03084 family metal-binding protein [Vineibacter terrae]TXL81565.1 TIGR03084 family protein [Vineibacter terrae]
MLQQVTDLRDEADELHRLLAPLAADDWSRPTQFKAWTVNDIVQHLHVSDLLGLASATDAAAFAALHAEIRARREAGLSRLEETRQRMDGLTGAALLARWRQVLSDLCDALGAKAPDARLTWVGPDMGLRMFATARQMEIWSHAQAIYDLLGITRPAPSPRIRNIAELGVRTFGWAYRNRGLDVPQTMPSVRLENGFGPAWEWPAPDTGNAVSGSVLAFCQVVTQTRNVADTDLVVSGDVARHWMSIAQCFAGPPETPPAPGTRNATPRG